MTVCKGPARVTPGPCYTNGRCRRPHVCTLPDHPDNAPRPARQSPGIGSPSRSPHTRRRCVDPSCVDAARDPSLTAHGSQSTRSPGPTIPAVPGGAPCLYGRLRRPIPITSVIGPYRKRWIAAQSVTATTLESVDLATERARNMEHRTQLRALDPAGLHWLLTCDVCDWRIVIDDSGIDNDRNYVQASIDHTRQRPTDGTH